MKLVFTKHKFHLNMTKNLTLDKNYLFFLFLFLLNVPRIILSVNKK
jgi:hypothetical protein